ncbi:acyl-CoA thioesterase [Citricoccus sp. GCM10030269]|uniref:acyl-CoA thioesterase n=1 Tax=Citricoccus sp. GCM10030269 TaxID=3273388 RepID=UPI0036241DA6
MTVTVSNYPTPEPHVYEFELGLRWSDQDLLGHLNNAKIVTLAEEARVRFLAHLTAQQHSSEGEARRVVARQVIDYHAQAMYAPAITMRVGVSRSGTKSYTLRHQGIQDGQAVFTVDAVLVTLGEDGRSRALTENERAELAAWMWPED